MIQRGLWLAIYFGVLIWSGIAPKPGLTWLLEWGVALPSGDAAVAFLATQGAPWDTHSDIGFALLGALLALLLLRKWHDRQLARLSAGPIENNGKL